MDWPLPPGAGCWWSWTFSCFRVPASWCLCQHHIKEAWGAHPASSGTSHTYQRVPALLCKDIQILCYDSPKWLKQQFIFFNCWLERLMLPFGTANAAFWRLCFYSRGPCCDWRPCTSECSLRCSLFSVPLSAWQNRRGLQALFREARDHRCWLGARELRSGGVGQKVQGRGKQRRSQTSQFIRPESTFQFHVQGQSFSLRLDFVIQKVLDSHF